MVTFVAAQDRDLLVGIVSTRWSGGPIIADSPRRSHASGMMGTDLTSEYAAVQQAFGYGIDDLERISLDASFAPPEEQRGLRRRFEQEFLDLRAHAVVPDA